MLHNSKFYQRAFVLDRSFKIAHIGQVFDSITETAGYLFFSKILENILWTLVLNLHAQVRLLFLMMKKWEIVVVRRLRIHLLKSNNKLGALSVLILWNIKFTANNISVLCTSLKGKILFFSRLREFLYRLNKFNKLNFYISVQTRQFQKWCKCSGENTQTSSLSASLCIFPRVTDNEEGRNGLYCQSWRQLSIG